jgi:hypothetical protein
LEKQQVPGVSGADTCSGQTIVRLVICIFLIYFQKKKAMNSCSCQQRLVELCSFEIVGHLSHVAKATYSHRFQVLQHRNDACGKLIRFQNTKRTCAPYGFEHVPLTIRNTNLFAQSQVLQLKSR